MLVVRRGQHWPAFWHCCWEVCLGRSDSHHRSRLWAFSLVGESGMNSGRLDHSTHRLSNPPVKLDKIEIEIIAFEKFVKSKKEVTYVCLAFTANNTSFAVITSPTFLLEMQDQVCTVDSTWGMHRISTAIAWDQGFFFPDGIQLLCTETFHANG